MKLYQLYHRNLMVQLHILPCYRLYELVFQALFSSNIKLSLILDTSRSFNTKTNGYVHLSTRFRQALPNILNCSLAVCEASSSVISCSSRYILLSSSHTNGIHLLPLK